MQTLGVSCRENADPHLSLFEDRIRDSQRPAKSSADVPDKGDDAGPVTPGRGFTERAYHRGLIERSRGADERRARLPRKGRFDLGLASQPERLPFLERDVVLVFLGHGTAIARGHRTGVNRMIDLLLPRHFLGRRFLLRRSLVRRGGIRLRCRRGRGRRSACRRRRSGSAGSRCALRQSKRRLHHQRQRCRRSQQI